MNKFLKILTIIIVLIPLAGCGKVKTYNEISFTELNQMIENKEDFALVIGSATCSACKAYKITMDKIIEKYQLDIKYIDISKLSEDQQSELSSTFAFNGTPTTVFVKKGKEPNTQNRIKGNEKYSKVIEKLTKNGYIKEK